MRIRDIFPLLILMTMPFNAQAYTEEKVRFTTGDGVVLTWQTGDITLIKKSGRGVKGKKVTAVAFFLFLK